MSLDQDKTDRLHASGCRIGRAFYAAPVSEFRVSDDEAFIDRLYRPYARNAELGLNIIILLALKKTHHLRVRGGPN